MWWDPENGPALLAPGGVPESAATDEVAALDLDGVIIWVNQAWIDFCVGNGGDLNDCGVGTSYLDACARVSEDVGAAEVAAAIRAATADRLPAALRVRIQCEGPSVQRFYDVLISSRHSGNGACVGATVVLSPVGPISDLALVRVDLLRRQQWQAASSDVIRSLISGELEKPLDIVLSNAMQAAGGDLALMVRPVGQYVKIESTVGALADQLDGAFLPLVDSVAEPVLTFGHPALVEDCAAVRRALGPIRTVLGSLIIAPLMIDDRVEGAVTVGRVPGRDPFTAADLDQLAAFTNHVGIALELDRGRAEREELRLLRDRDQKADELLDRVARELLSTGLGLQTMIHGLELPKDQEQIATFVDSIDATIRRIRSGIVAFSEPQTSRRSLRSRVLSLLDATEVELGFQAHIEFSGPLDLRVPPEVGDDIIAVISQALANVARHAAARSAHVRIAQSGQLVTVEVRDDGHGVGSALPAAGLDDLRARAELHGGNLVLAAPATGGTWLVWSARLPRA